MEYADDPDTFFDPPVKNQMVGELFQWEHSYAGEERAPAVRALAHFRLTGKEPKGLFRGAVEAKTGLEGWMSSQVLGLARQIPVCRRPEDNTAFHRATLADLCLSRSSLRLLAQ